MARHRSFSFEFKRQVVLDFLEGRGELRGLAREHNLSRHLIRLWIQKYEAGQLNDEVADATRIAEYETKIAELERKVGQLTMEVDLLKKGGALGTPAERREFLDRERSPAISIAGGCRVMKLARSTYYYRNRRSAAEKIVLHEHIAELTAEFPRYGYRRVTHQLRSEGLHVNHKAVARKRSPGAAFAPFRAHHPERSSEPDLSKPGGGLHSDRTQPIVGIRSDLRRDRRRLRLCRCDS